MKPSVPLLRCTLPLLLLFHFLLFTNSSLRASETKETLTVYFPSDVDELDPPEIERLIQFMAPFKSETNLSIEIHGHTDAIGGEAYNLDLSKRRGSNTKLKLIDQGFNAFDITSKAFGKHALLHESVSEGANQVNRRVEIIVTVHHFESNEELTSALSMDTRHQFKFDPTVDNTIATDRGTQLFIPANVVQTEDGKPCSGMVILTLREALSPLDFLTENLETLSTNEPLESGGMVHIEMQNEQGRTVLLADNKAIELGLPAETTVNDMSIFVSSDGADWSNTEQEVLTAKLPNLPTAPFIKHYEWRPPVHLLKIPAEPRKIPAPIKPTKPDAEPDVVKAAPKWWQFRERLKLRKQNESSRSIDPRLERYNRAYARYVEDSSSYSSRVQAYEKALARWTVEKASIERNYEEVIVPNSKAEWEEERSKIEASLSEEFRIWRAVCDSIQSEHYEKLSKMNLLNTSTVQYYGAQLMKLGWINCDRFYGVPEAQKRAILVDASAHPEAKLCLVFDQRKSMMGVANKGANSATSRVPSEAMTLLAYYVDDGKIMMSTTKVDRRKHVRVECQATSLSEFRTIMAGLGKPA